MKTKTGFKVVTWIISIGVALGVGALCTLLVMAFVPATFSPLDPILLLASAFGFGLAAFGLVWLCYRIAKAIWIRRKAGALPGKTENAPANADQSQDGIS